MARVLQYICGGLVIGILSVIVNIHPAAAIACTGDVCQNGGTCPASGNTPCECADGYYGQTCETAEVACASDVCQNGGTCPASGKTPCECADGFLGGTCDTVRLCTTAGKECGAHGTCDTSETKCTCKDSYTGNLCATAPKSSSPAVRLSLMSLVVSSIVCFVVL